MTSRSKYWVQLIVLFILYFIAGKLSLKLALLNPSASPIWPPTGIALAALLIGGYRYWPAIFFGAFAVNVTTAGTLASSIGIALGNTLEGLVGAHLVHTYARGVHAFERPLNVFRFAVFGGLVGPALAATLGVTSLLLAGSVPQAQYWWVWFTWWMGDIGGAWVMAPAIILWYKAPRAHWHAKRIFEFALLILSLLSVTAIIFSGIVPYPYAWIPVLLWAALRFGPKELSLLLLLVASISIWEVLHQAGPFIQNSATSNEALLQVQLFVGVITITSLIVAAVSQERAAAEQHIFKQERHFRALIEKSSDAISLIDDKANILYASPSIERVLGYTPEEFVHTPGLTKIHPDDATLAAENLKTILSAQNKTTTVEVRVQRRDGTWVWIESTGRNLLHDPAVGAIVVNFRDISERKKLEQSKNDFLMIAAHQLRSPLAAMRWSMELILREAKKISPAIRTKLNALNKLNQNTIAMVNELLTVSRILQGEIPNEPKTITLHTTLQKEIDSILPLAKKQQVSIILTTRNRKETVFVDPQRLSHILQNLLSNAIKYNKKGGSVTVAWRQTKIQTEISVTDTGIGIPTEDHDQLFTKFFRASNAKEAIADGGGLGLFVVKSYVEAWGGIATAESPLTQNGGTRMTITIPTRTDTHTNNVKGA